MSEPKRIYKFPIETIDEQTIGIPRHARILCVQSQHGAITLWAEVDPKAAKENRTFHVIGTGHPIPDGALTYIGSVQQPPFMWHIYEETR